MARSDEVAEIEGWSFGIFSTDLMIEFDAWATASFQYGSIIIWAKIKLIVCDEAALKATLDTKGASGNLPCFKCTNVLSRQAYGRSDKRASLCSITEVNPNKFDLHNGQSIRENAEHIRDMAPPVLKVGQWKQLQVALGVNHNPRGIMLRIPDFDVAVGACYDPQHVFLVNGIFQSEVGQLTKVLKKECGTKLSDIAVFFRSFQWPHSSSTGQNIFDDRSERSVTERTAQSHPVFNCAASDALGSFAVLQEFLMIRIFAEAQRSNNRRVLAACSSFFALCAVLTLLTMIPRGGVTGAILMTAIIKHFKLHKAAYGDAHWVPKFHYALHLPGQLVCWGLLILCFTHERKHKEIKRYLQGRQNTSATFEKNILQDVLHLQALALQEEQPYPCGTQLLHPRKPTVRQTFYIKENFPDCIDIERSIDAKAGNFVTCHVDDVVYFHWDDSMAVGAITLLCCVDGMPMTRINVFTRLPQRNMYDTKGDL